MSARTTKPQTGGLFPSTRPAGLVAIGQAPDDPASAAPPPQIGGDA